MTILYKLIRKADNVVLAEGTKAEIVKLHRKTPGCQIWLSTQRPLLRKETK